MAVTIHPLNRSTGDRGLTGQVRQRATLGDRKLSPTRRSTRNDTLNDWRRSAGRGEPLKIEWHGKQCPIVEIDYVAARHNGRDSRHVERRRACQS